jgi:hypothetical protein
VDAARVRATFAVKIAPSGLTEFVFGIHSQRLDPEASQLVERYFAQGYDVNFVDIQEWLFNNLGAVGVRGRQLFQEGIRHPLGGVGIPKALKQFWSEKIGKLVA